jgi:hypothetical protein
MEANLEAQARLVLACASFVRAARCRSSTVPENTDAAKRKTERDIFGRWARESAYAEEDVKAVS